MHSYEKVQILDQEVKLLEGKKQTLETEIERLTKIITTKERDADKKIDKEYQEYLEETNEIRKKLEQERLAIEKSKKLMAKVEVEQKLLEDDAKKIKLARGKLQEDEKATEVAKKEYLEATRLAKLKEEQYNGKLRDLGYVEKPKVEVKKVEKKVIKKGKK